MSHQLTSMQLHEASQLLSQPGWTQKSLATRYGVSEPTLSRLLAKFRESGDATTAVKKNYATGPRDEHALSFDEAQALKNAMLKKRSRKLAAEELMQHADCTAETFDRLAAIFDAAADSRTDEVWPKWFVRACILTDEEKLSFLGPKHLASVEPARPRGLFYEADGERHPLMPNAVWEFDDESENTPWVELDAEGKARVNRQTLKAIDVYSSFYLGMKAISRSSDGYRVEDQADFLMELIDAHGMPLRCRIERGPWDNNFWWGIPMPKAWWQTETCPAFRFGGIDTSAGGPIGVIQCFKSRHKGTIEGSFNHRQDIAAHETLDIGRSRGEHEAAAKHLTRAYTNQADAIARFPDAAGRADISADVMQRFNSEAKRRRNLFGSKKVVPAELYATAVRRDLPAADRWRFLPVKVATTVRNAHLQMKVKDHELPFLFTAEGFQPQWDWHAYLPHGWRLFAAFHPHRPDLGCHIFNALHPSHAQNPQRFPLGMPMGVLPMAERAPQFSDAPRDFADRKRTLAAIRSETRVMKATQKGVRVSTVITNGSVRAVRKGAPDPLLHLDSGAPPAPPVPQIETNPFLERGADGRSAHTGSAEHSTDDRRQPIGPVSRASGHGPTRHAQGSSSTRETRALQTSADRLAELEAALD